MKFNQPVICMFCVQPITKQMKLRLPRDLRKVEVDSMIKHEVDCTQWNKHAFIIRNTDL